MANCEHLQNSISAYIDGELSEKETAELEAHLAECEDCRRTLGFFRELSALERESLVEPPAELHGSIMAAVRREKSRKRLRFIPKVAGGVLAASLALIVVWRFGFGGFGASEENASAPGSAEVMMASFDDADAVAGIVEAGSAVTTGADSAATYRMMPEPNAAPAEGGTAAYGDSASHDDSAEDSDGAASYKNASTAAYDPTEPTESPTAIEGLSLDPETDTGNTTNDFTSSAETAPEEQSDGTAETASLPAAFRLPNISVADAIVDNRIVIDADAVTDFSYDNRVYDPGDDADVAEMREKLDYFASLGLTPLDGEPDAELGEPIGCTIWYGDTILVFVLYEDGYVVEGENWYSFE